MSTCGGVTRNIYIMSDITYSLRNYIMKENRPAFHNIRYDLIIKTSHSTTASFLFVISQLATSNKVRFSKKKRAFQTD